jgi:hypothetical protein
MVSTRKEVQVAKGSGLAPTTGHSMRRRWRADNGWQEEWLNP